MRIGRKRTEAEMKYECEQLIRQQHKCAFCGKRIFRGKTISYYKGKIYCGGCNPRLTAV